MNDFDRYALLRQCRLDGMKDLFRGTGRYSDTHNFTAIGFASHRGECEHRKTRAVCNRVDGESEEILP
jgi:hypothetical protein